MGTDVTFDKLLLEAADLLFQGDLVKAQAKINRALARKAGEPRALGILAGILSAQEDHAGAAAIYRNLLQQFGDEPTLHFKLALECFALGDLNVGYEEISEAVMCDPDNGLLQKFKKHVAQAMGLIKDFDQDPAELPDDLYKTIIKIYGKSEHHSGLLPAPVRKEDSQRRITREHKGSSSGKPKHKSTPQVTPVATPPVEKETGRRNVAVKESGPTEPSIFADVDSSQGNVGLAVREGSVSGVSGLSPVQSHTRPTGKYKRSEMRETFENANTSDNRYVVSNAEGIYTIDPSQVESLAFSREFLMFPLTSGWYLRENLLLCSYMDFDAEHAQERYRGTDSERSITDEITGRLLEVRGRGTAILKPSAEHVLIAFDIHNTPLYLREEMVVAFQGNLKWESGWLRSKSQRVGMLSFRGRGKIFIQMKGSLFNLELPEEEFLLTPLEKLIGWEGYVVAQCNQGELLHAAGSGNLFLRN